jgi:hypothetical protein
MVRKVREKEIETTLTRRVTQEEKRCPVCKRMFWGAKISRYCSRVCRNKAHYERHAEEYRKNRVRNYQRQKNQATKE